MISINDSLVYLKSSLKVVAIPRLHSSFSLEASKRPSLDLNQRAHLHVVPAGSLACGLTSLALCSVTFKRAEEG